MLTLFSIPKPFEGGAETIQRNALVSWSLLRPRPTIVLLGNEPGAHGISEELGFVHVADVATSEFGTPLVNDAFARAEALAQHETLAYVNADIVLTNDFVDAAQRIARRGQFLMVGRRTDLDVDTPLRFKPDWEARLRHRAKMDGVLHSESAIDYFVFPRGLWRSIPPFAVGRFSWDNWLVYDARARKVPVIDATRSILAVHQNHGYPGGLARAGSSAWNREIERNFRLAGELAGTFTIVDATHVLIRGFVAPALTPRRLVWRARRVAITRLPHVSPPLRRSLGRVLRVFDREKEARRAA